ncbi:MAG: ankyrin repeat domain-containing protein [Candidatus Berkiella sp.]
MAYPNLINDITRFIQDNKEIPELIELTRDFIRTQFPETQFDDKTVQEIIKLSLGEYAPNSLFDALKKNYEVTSHQISHHGFDEKEYAKLLIYMKLAEKTQGTSVPDLKAYKLAVAFGDADIALQYLSESQKKHSGSLIWLEQACQFDLPENNQWDVAQWRKIISKHLLDPSFSESKLLKYAPRIQKYLQDKGLAQLQLPPDVEQTREAIEKLAKEAKSLEDELQKLNAQAKEYRIKKLPLPEALSKEINRIKKEQQLKNKEKMRLEKKIDEYRLLSDIPFDELTQLVPQVHYQHAAKDPLAARLFYRYDIPEAIFENYLLMKPQVKNSDAQIPPIVINGKELGLGECYLIKLSMDDPKGPILGHITGCCQSTGKLGSSTAHHGFRSENGGFYVLCAGKPPKDRDTKKIKPGDIIAESWAWRAQDGNIVLDSIESQANILAVKSNQVKIVQMFNALAETLTSNHNVPEVRLGMGGSASNVIEGKKVSHPSVPNDYDNYRDSLYQKAVNKPELPLYFQFDTNFNEAFTAYLNLDEDKRKEYDDITIYNYLIERGNNDNLIAFLNLIDPKERKSYVESKNLMNLAIKAGKSEFISTLMQYQLDLYKRHGSSHDDSHVGIAKDKPEILYLLTKDFIQKAIDNPTEVDNVDVAGNSALMLAVAAGKVDDIEKLLRNGANPLLNYPKLENNAFTTLNSANLNKATKKAINHLLTKHCILKDQNDINAKVTPYRTLLGMACEYDDNLLAEELIEKGANVNLSTNEKPLNIAVKAGSFAVAELLLKNHAELDMVSYMNPMAFAAMNNNIAVIKFLLEHGVNIRAKNDNKSPLETAAYEHNPTLVIFLLNELTKRDLNVEDVSGAFAATKEFRLKNPTDERVKNKQKIQELLLQVWFQLAKKSNELDKPNASHETILMHACAMNNESLVYELLKNGANPNVRSRGLAPITDAIKNGNATILALLIKYGAKIGPELMDIETNSNQAKILILETWVNQKLSETPPDADWRSNNGKTLLMYACELGDFSVVEKLLANGADSTLKDKNNNTLLHYAAKSGNTEILSELVNRKLDINAQNSRKHPPILAAAESGHKNAVRFLLENGAIIDEKTKASLTQTMKGSQNVPSFEFCYEAIMEHQDRLQKKRSKIAQAISNSAVKDESKRSIGNP